LAILPGDGVGPDVLAEGIKVLEAIGKKYGHDFELTQAYRWVAISAEGTALSDDTLESAVQEQCFSGLSVIQV
jgi:3-isopropylmalate dehydrogenase